MTALSVLPGGGERSRPGTCGICAVPHNGPCPVLRRHKDHLRLKGYTANTIYCRGRHVIRLAAALPVSLLDADPATLMAWRASLDLSPGSTASYVSAADQFFRWAVAEGMRPDNPATGLPVPRAPRRVPRPMSERDLMAALETAPPRIRLWIVLASYCGLRSCEIAGILRESIMDTATPPVLIVTAETAKGGHVERVIPLSRFVLDELAAVRLPNSGYAFRRHDGAAGPNQAWLISHLVNRHLRSIGVTATLHQMRHRMLSRCYQQTLDLRLVQDLAGHADPRTTAGYAAFANANAVKAVNALPAPRRRGVKGGRTS